MKSGDGEANESSEGFFDWLFNVFSNDGEDSGLIPTVDIKNPFKDGEASSFV